jgi:hypothetical protein
MKSKLTVAFLFLLSFFSFWASPVRAESIPDKPPLSGVYDPHSYLSKKVVEKVATFNWEYSKTKLQPQIAVVVVDTVDDDIESVARETARSWHVGFSDTNYGTLVLISIKERKIRTETSNNMGTIIPDAEAAELNDLVKSDFRNENYSEGVLTYLSAFKSKIDDYIKNNQSGEKKGSKKSSTLAEKSLDNRFFLIGSLFFLFLLVFFLVGSVVSDSIEKKKQLKERCQFDYNGEDKIFPDSEAFKENPSWTDERIAEFYKNKEIQKAEEKRKLEEKRLAELADRTKRSDFFYSGEDKLYPEDKDYVDGTWSLHQMKMYYLDRSTYSYDGDDKLYPDSKAFVENSSWTPELKEKYYKETIEKLRSKNRHFMSQEDQERSSSFVISSGGFSSYSGSSSSSWSGGGFDGGGATGGW